MCSGFASVCSTAWIFKFYLMYRKAINLTKKMAKCDRGCCLLISSSFETFIRCSFRFWFSGKFFLFIFISEILLCYYQYKCLRVDAHEEGFLRRHDPYRMTNIAEILYYTWIIANVDFSKYFSNVINDFVEAIPSETRNFYQMIVPY